MVQFGIQPGAPRHPASGPAAERQYVRQRQATPWGPMFESIAIRHQNVADGENPLDLGFLAEALLFYQSVRVIADPGIFKQLIRSMGPELLTELLDQGHLNLTYLENGLAVQTRNANTTEARHDACVYSAPHLVAAEFIPRFLEETIGRRGRARRVTNRLMSRMQVASFEADITNNAREDFGDDQYVEAAVATIIRSYAPEYDLPDPLQFSVRRDCDSFIVETNLDFDAVNRVYHRRIPVEHSSLSPEYLLSFLTNIRGHLFFASEYSAEVAAESVNAEILGHKIARLAASRAKSDAGLSFFQDFIFDDGRAVREAINGGDRSFGELVELLEKAKDFKAWLRDQEPDQNLVKSYFREVTESSWIDRLPAKTARWSVFTGAGLAIDAAGAEGLGTLTGVALSAADAFLLDKLLKGWRPTRFIEDNLAEFLSKENN